MGGAMTTMMKEPSVNPVQTRIGTVLSLLVLCALPAAGQQQDASPKAVIFTFQDFSAGGENKDYEQPITASISAAFEVGGYGIVAPETWAGEVQRRALNPRALLSQETASSVAQAAGADLAVTGYFTVLENSIYISLQCWDVAKGVLAAGLQQTARFNIAFYSSLHERVVEMLPADPPGAAWRARRPTGRSRQEAADGFRSHIRVPR